MKRKHPLRRIMIGVAATASGVVLLLALKQPGGSSVAGTTAPVRAGGGVSASAGADAGAAAQAPSGTGADAGGGTGPDTGTGTDSGTGAGTGSGAGAAVRTVLGDAVDTQYGPVQVQITLSGGRITKAEAVQSPGGSISANAVPRLNEAAVTARNARIDAVSGASYTSKGYQDSLQSALDKAGV
ncbi:FMN-binding protein [Streptomyces sp. NBC_00872]|uniref:FMN-binding protein n=1 Tax=Streptomyces sp. NBC_00872 TaxID=2903686 RepID=UPI003867CD71|nr:FMN-binding protein [Streptomyces sp. NBC_00872]